MAENFAPVLIPTLNRFIHLRSCILSLLDCEGVDKTDLFIALDYPSKDSHWEGYNKIVNFLDVLIGFKSITIIKREVNFGASENILDGYNIIFKNYSRLILSEDDNIFSKDFLIYMNKTLELYEYDLNVFSVSGYNYPINMPNHYDKNIYLWCGFSAWGVGLWRDKFQKINFSEDDVRNSVLSFFRKLNRVRKFNEIANIYIPSLIHMTKGKMIHGDIYISLYQFLHNMNSVFPVISRVRNIGNDGSGVNCNYIEDDIYSKQEIFEGPSNYEISNIKFPNKYISESLKKHFYLNKKSQFKIFCKVVFINLGLYKI